MSEDIKYDSTEDTLKHIQNVQTKILSVIVDLGHRAAIHDQSKLKEPEKAVYDEFTPLLANLEYGSQEYKDTLKKMQVGIDHHYANNSHHPEYVKIHQEWWKDVDGFTDYEVSSLGQVRSKKTGKIIRSYKTPKGYLRLQLSLDGVPYNKMVHVLVAKAYIPNPEGKPFVNHRDGNKSNNLISNLEWVTSSENQIHAYETGLKEPATKYIVKCVDLGIITEGTYQMQERLRELGYSKASAAGVWASINSDNRKHLDLNFEGYLIEEYGSISYVDGMSLMDLMEMLCDWKAAGERHKNKPSDIFKSIEINAERFKMDDQLKQILLNTAAYLYVTTE